MSSPHFIIAGERRSGSSTLYEILKQHPEVEMYHKSDFDFFIEIYGSLWTGLLFAKYTSNIIYKLISFSYVYFRKCPTKN